MGHMEDRKRQREGARVGESEGRKERGREGDIGKKGIQRSEKLNSDDNSKHLAFTKCQAHIYSVRIHKETYINPHVDTYT